MDKKRIGIYALLALGSFGSMGIMSSCSDKPLDSRFEYWNEEQAALMDAYCGGYLPYDSSYFSDEMTIKEADEPGTTTSYLEIKDSGIPFSSFLSYYTLLEDYGWEAVSTVKEGVIQTSSEGYSFVELTKIVDGRNTGYDMVYYYVDESEDEEGNVIPGYNLIKCYASLSGVSTSATSWSKSEKSLFYNTIGVELPFIALGRGYSINRYTYTYSFDPTVIQIVDTYAKDLSKDYCSILMKNGFGYEKLHSYTSNAYCLSKTLDDGGKISVYLYYYGGNAFEFIYTPKETELTSWPSDISNEVKEKAGVDLPIFSIADGGHYYTYHRGDSYTIYTTDYDESFDYIEYAENQINFVGFGWDEKASFRGAILTDSDQNPVGFALNVTLTEPTSTFVNAYPNDKVKEVVSSLLGISDVNIPSFPNEAIPPSDKKVKYEILGKETYDSYYEYYYGIISDYREFYIDELGENPSEEDISALAAQYAYKEEGISISIYDQNKQAYLAYGQTLFDAGWYGGRNVYGDLVYEDPEGKIAITLEEPEVASTHDNFGKTVINIHPGSAESHSPAMYFTKEELEVAIGDDTTDLNECLVTNMLPYEVSFSSSDTTGKITVDKDGILSVASDATDGMKATITASLKVPGESSSRTASITIIAVRPYNSAAIIDDIASIIKEKGYTPSVTHSAEDYLTVSFPSSWGVDDIKKFVDDNLILDGFELISEDGCWSDWEDDNVMVYPEEKQYAGCYISYSWQDVYPILIDYQIYEKGGKYYLQIFAI